MTNLFLLEKFVSIVMMYLSTLLWPGGSGVGQFSQLTSSDEKYSAGWPGASSVTELDRKERGAWRRIEWRLADVDSCGGIGVGDW